MSEETIYLACPYSPLGWLGLPIIRTIVMAWRHRVANIVAARLMTAGYVVFSPLSHSHRIAPHLYVSPTDNEFWLAQCLPWLRASQALRIIPIGGWDKSKGLSIEIDEANRIEVPVSFVDPPGFLEVILG
ncbi:MAG: DUF1937 family protein [Pseudomonadota bacterium]